MEYENGAIADLCNENMISQEFSAPNVPEQSSNVEHSNRAIVEIARTMLQDAVLSNSTGSDAAFAATYVQNLCPTTALNGKAN